MKYLVILLFLIGNAACNSSLKESVPEAEAEMEVSEELPFQESINPGELILLVKILESYNSSKEICGLAKKNVSLIEVMEVEQAAMGIVNLPRKGEELQIAFISSHTLEAGSLIRAVAKESLCPEASKTYYTVKSYQIAE